MIEKLIHSFLEFNFASTAHHISINTNKLAFQLIKGLTIILRC